MQIPIPQAGRTPRRRTYGFTLVELLFVLAIFAIIVAIGALNLRGLQDPLHEAATNVAGLMKQSRAKAMATTSAYRVKVSTSNARDLVTESAISCSDTSGWAADGALSTELPKGISMSVSQGSLPTCFDPRGLGSQDLILTFTDAKGRSMKVEVMLGGAVRMLS